jgi:hypothetical protein
VDEDELAALRQQRGGVDPGHRGRFGLFYFTFHIHILMLQPIRAVRVRLGVLRASIIMRLSRKLKSGIVAGFAIGRH